MAELPKIDSEGLRLAKKAGAERVSSVAKIGHAARPADAAETIRQRILEWQRRGWTHVPARSGAEQILSDLDRSGFKIVPKEH